MPQFTLTYNKTAVENKIKKLRTSIEGFRDEFLEGMSEEIILNSPVDTGTYITAHEIGVGRRRGGGFVSSKGKPRNQPYSPYAQEGLNQLFADIRALPESADYVTIRNNAAHADVVEYELGYAPYGQARREAGRIAREAAQKAKANGNL